MDTELENNLLMYILLKMVFKIDFHWPKIIIFECYPWIILVYFIVHFLEKKIYV